MKSFWLTLIFSLIFGASSIILAQEQSEQPATEDQELKQVLSQEGYDKTSPSIVKMVTDAGRRIGTGILLAVHKDDVGFVLTSYSMVAGRDKVAIILKDHSDPLLGRVVDKWIDFDLDLAIIGIKDFPEGQEMITIGDDRKLETGKVVTAIAHAEDGDDANSNKPERR